MNPISFIGCMRKDVSMTGLKSSLVMTFFVLGVSSQMCSGGERMNVLFLCVDDLNAWLLSDPNRYAGKVKNVNENS